MYVITGATGNTGHVVAQKLLEAGKPVRAIGRAQERLQPLVEAGAQAVVGSLEDPAVLSAAFQGATAVYTMIPPDYSAENYRQKQQQIGEAIVAALRDRRVAHVVNLSSIGAQNRSGAGPVSGLGQQEDRLEALAGTHVLHLRPGLFMENLYGFLDMIRGGFVAAPLAPDLAMPWIATRDIGAAAADALLRLDFKGKSTRELHGPRDVSWAEATRIIGKAVGKPDLRYVRASYEDAENGLVQAGFSADVARGFVEMYRAMNEGRMRSLESRNDRNTTPTSLETFVKGLAGALG